MDTPMVPVLGADGLCISEISEAIYGIVALIISHTNSYDRDLMDIQRLPAGGGPEDSQNWKSYSCPDGKPCNTRCRIHCGIHQTYLPGYDTALLILLAFQRHKEKHETPAPSIYLRILPAWIQSAPVRRTI
jgi:hypothetical protein